MHTHCNIISMQTGKSVASFEVERHINCFMFIQVLWYINDEYQILY